MNDTVELSPKPFIDPAIDEVSSIRDSLSGGYKPTRLASGVSVFRDFLRLREIRTVTVTIPAGGTVEARGLHNIKKTIPFVTNQLQAVNTTLVYSAPSVDARYFYFPVNNYGASTLSVTFYVQIYELLSK